MTRTLSIAIKENTYQELKSKIGLGKISAFVNQAVIKELKKHDWKPQQTNRWTFSKFLEKVKKEMGIGEKVELSPHTLRRCFATYQAISGMPLPVLQKVLGHSKVSTTALYIRDGDLGNLVKFRPV